MPISAYVQDIPRPFLIAAMVMGFIWFWPVGLMVLGYLIGSGRLRRGRCGPGRWYNTAQPDGQAGGPSCSPWGSWSNWGPSWSQPKQAPGSSNRAFDDYRAETLRRLEEEQKEFVDYLERLRQARDKAEFDQFMADRRGRPTPPTEA